MCRLQKGDRVVLKDSSGVSLYFHNTGTVYKPIRNGHTGTVISSLKRMVTVRFDGDSEGSQDLREDRFEKIGPEIRGHKKIFYPCSHDYQELEDFIQLGK